MTLATDRYRIIHGDCLEEMRKFEDGSFDAIITDPPYPEIDREYGRMTESEWTELMHAVVRESIRLVGGHGSAVFILKPNSRKIGSLRPWLYDFMSWVCHEWNVIQDVWWENTATAPTFHCTSRAGLCKPSLAACVWVGDPDSYRNQAAVLNPPSASTRAMDLNKDILRHMNSGHMINDGRIARSALARGGVAPMNVLLIANANSTNSSAAYGHPAGTPYRLLAWWCRYLTPPGGLILDPFCGAGTTLVAATDQGFCAVGIERKESYVEMTRRRLEDVAPLFRGGDAA